MSGMAGLESLLGGLGSDKDEADGGKHWYWNGGWWRRYAQEWDVEWNGDIKQVQS